MGFESGLSATGLQGLDKVFEPRRIAVIGASNSRGSVGFTLFNNLIGGGFRGYVYPVNPFRLNQRATIQQSIFMCPSHVDLTFEDNLISQQSKGEILLRKFMIRSDDRKGVLKDLYSMNITRATLFPGLEGYARSLKTYLLLPETWVE